MTFQVQQNSFNSGELAPDMLGRSDLDYYQHGAQTLENFLIRPQGGIIQRSGTRFVLECKDSSVKSRLVPFVFSTTQAYILEFSDLRIRFFRSEAVIQALTHLFADGNVSVANDEINETDHFYVDEQGPFRLTTTGTLPAGLAVDTDYYIVNTGLTGTPATDYFALSLTPGGATVDITGAAGGGTHAIVPYGIVPHELVTTYTEAELPDLRFAQSADLLYITHENHAPAILSRIGHTHWTLADHALIDGPYLSLRTQVPGAAKELDTLYMDAGLETGTGMQIGAGAAVFVDPRDVGRLIRYVVDPAGTGSGSLRITSVSSLILAIGDVVSGNDPLEEPPHLVDALATPWWHFGAYYPANYPRLVAFFEGRLAFAGTPLEPERFDASVTGGWDDFTLVDRSTNEPADDSGITYYLGGANDVQVIRWLATIRNLIIGTTGGIWPVQASSGNEAVTPTNINLPRSSAYGCADVTPVTAFDTVVYVSRTGKKILTAGFSYESDSYRTEDLTIMASHVTGTGIDFLEYQQEPHSVVWALRGDGQLAGMTYERGQKVHGWHRHIIGGSFGAGDAVVESIAVIPAPNEDHDQLWMIVKRTIDGNTVRYIEFMEQDFSDTDVLDDAFFLDSGLTYDSTPTASISGLAHLEGETVQILTDGETHPDRTVSAAGSITLDAEYSVVHVGYSYNANCESLPPELQDRRGSSIGRTKRPTHAALRLHRTMGLEYGEDASNLTAVSHSALFTGLETVTLKHAHGLDPVLYLRQPDPLPAMILSVAGTTGVAPR